jgi:hypothetical protein
MAQDLRCCNASDTLVEADVGLLSLADLAREAARERGSTRPAIREQEVGDTLASICQPRHAAA